MDALPIIEERTTFPVGSLQLEGILAYPEIGTPSTSLLFVAPHPHLGGNMNNNVIRHLARRVAEEGCLSLRFNYRGVGESAIALSEGKTLFDHWAALEREQRYDELMPDVHNAFRTLHDVAPYVARRIVVGYSLGVLLALKLAGNEPLDGLIGISPPNVKRPFPEALPTETPLYFVGGDADFIFDPTLLIDTLAKQGLSNAFVKIPACDHFFRKREEDLYQAIRAICFEEWASSNANGRKAPAL